MGLPNDAPRWKVKQIRGMNDAPIDALYAQAGLSPRNLEGTETKVWTETMTAHRLAQYAASISPEKGEIVWTALSRRFFEGKDTSIRPIRLDDHALLLECAELAGLDLSEVRTLLASNRLEAEINDSVAQVHAAGIHAIPLFVIEAQGLATGSWLTLRESRYRKFHQGSGNKASFRAMIEQVRAAAAAASA